MAASTKGRTYICQLCDYQTTFRREWREHHLSKSHNEKEEACLLPCITFDGPKPAVNSILIKKDKDGPYLSLETDEPGEKISYEEAVFDIAYEIRKMEQSLIKIREIYEIGFVE